VNDTGSWELLVVFGADRKSNMAAMAHNLFWLVEILKIFLSELNCDFAGMIIGWSCTKLVNRLPNRKFKMATMTRLSLTLDPMGISHFHHFSSVVRPSTFHILIFSSEITGSIATKLWWNRPSEIVSGDPDFQPRWPPS
jgi:hypothetical protein